MQDLDRKTSDAHSATSARRSYNVLMIAPTMFFADYGCHVRILEEAIVLQEMGHRVTILAYPNGRDWEGLDIERCWGVPFNYRVVVGSSRHKIYLDVMLGLKSLGMTLLRRPDVIHAHLHEGALIGAVLSRLWRVPLVFDFQGSLTAEMIDHRFLRADGPFYRLMRWLEEVIDHLPQAIITSSHHAADLLREGFNCDAGRVHTISDRVNPNVFRPNVLAEQERLTLKQQLGIPPERKVVVYLGLLAPYQGTDLLLEAAVRVVQANPAVHFLIMGYPSEDYYRQRAREMGLDGYVTFTGRIPYEHAPRHLALGDVAVGPKLSATEGSGKLLNYMAMALPTVAFDTPVSREYLADLGIYAERVQASALAEALAFALANPSESSELGRKLRQLAIERYSWPVAGEEIVRVYDTICHRRRRAI